MRTYKNINKNEKKSNGAQFRANQILKIEIEEIKKKIKSIRVCMLKLEVGLLDWDKHIESK